VLPISSTPKWRQLRRKRRKRMLRLVERRHKVGHISSVTFGVVVGKWKELVAPNNAHSTRHEVRFENAASQSNEIGLMVTIDNGMTPLPPLTCASPFSFADFFKDTPWLNVPQERQAVLIEPLYPRGGLLGGSSPSAPKMSKLQALAAARKKKAEEQKSTSSGNDVAKPMEKLALGSEKSAVQTTGGSVEPSQNVASANEHHIRTYPARKRKSSSPHRKPSVPAEPTKSEVLDEVQSLDELVPQAKPSAFASAMFGNERTASLAHSSALFSLPYVRGVSVEPTDAFAGPSPDDVVIAAQSKGSAHSARPKN
jgi:hypothetical protein